MSLHDALTAVAWQRRLAMGAQGVDLGWGAAIVTADLPYVFDQNVVWVRERADPQQVLRRAEGVGAEAGWPHRTLEVSDQELAAHLRPELTAAGYGEVRNVTMVLRDDHDLAPAAAVAATAVVAIEEQQVLARALIAEEPWASSDVILDQFAQRERRLAEVTDGMAVIAPAVEPVSRCLLLSDGGFFEIDSVMTLSEHRGQGWSIAVMQRALQVGIATGRTVVLVADVSDWPRQWYERLGFSPVGVLSVFRRWPHEEAGGSAS